MLLELRHLRYFVAVAEELHFGRAARRLNVSQPPLSQQIKQLESVIGAPLFTRANRRVQLTPAGTTLLEGARRVLAEAARALAAAQRTGRGEVDTLRIGFTDSAALGGLTDIVRAFRVTHPGVHLDLVNGTTASQVDALDRDLVDVALVRGPVNLTGARVEVVRREPFFVALPSDHPLATRRTVSIADLTNEPFIFFPRHLAPGFHDVLTRMCRTAGFEPHVRIETGEYQTIMSLVSAGLGVTIVPDSVRNLHLTGVETRPLRGVRATAELVIVYHPHRLSRPLTAFISSALAAGAVGHAN